MSIEIRNLSFKYPKTNVLQNINLKIESGEVVALMGGSGSGKSTLIKIISSFLQPTSGDVLINENAVQVNKPYTSIAYVSQSSIKTLFPWLTVEDNIYYPNKLRGKLDTEAKQYCDELLSILKLEEKRKAFPLELSGGGQKRLSLAVALSYKPEIILLDEPFSGIDFKLSQELWDVLYSDFQKRKPTVLFVTHSLDEASILASKTVFLKNISQDENQEFFTLFLPVKTVFDFDGAISLPRYEQMTNPKIIDYRNYLLGQFNLSIK